MSALLEKIGGRKMAVGFLVLGIGVAFAAWKGDVSPGLLQLLSVIFGAFVVGNGFEHLADAMRKPEAVVAAIPTVDTSALEAKVEEVKALSAQAAAGSAASAEALSMIIKLYNIDKIAAERGLGKNEGGA